MVFYTLPTGSQRPLPSGPEWLHPDCTLSLLGGHGVPATALILVRGGDGLSEPEAPTGKLPETEQLVMNWGVVWHVGREWLGVPDAGYAQWGPRERRLRPRGLPRLLSIFW